MLYFGSGIGYFLCSVYIRVLEVDGFGFEVVVF